MSSETKFLIYGRGWIASFFEKELKSRGIDFLFGNSRVDNNHDLEEEIKNIKPSHIICCIGRTHGPSINNIDYLEGNLNINVRDNLFAPLNLAFYCEKNNIHLVYVGTGCIFEYDDEHLEPNGKFETKGFGEDDDPNFFSSSYSIVKGYTDRLMKNFNHVLNARIRMPISSQNHPRNFITKIVSYEKLINVQNSMTVLDQWIPALVNLSLSRVSGTLNCTNPGTISHNEIMEMYKKYVDHGKSWENFTIQEQNDILMAGRSNNQLDTNKICNIKECRGISEIHEAVEISLKSWEQ